MLQFIVDWFKLGGITSNDPKTYMKMGDVAA
jgi:hypothetical protein